MTILETEGGVRVNEGAARVSSTLPPSARLDLDGAARLVLGYAGSDRVVLRGPARALVGDLGPAQLILWRGEAWLERSAKGRQQRSPLRVGTPVVSAECPQPVTLWLGVRRDGATRVSVVSGSALAVGATGEVKMRTLELDAGRTVMVKDTLEHGEPGPATLQAAAERGRAFAASSPDAGASAGLEPNTRRLRAALAALRRARDKSRSLAASQRRAAKQGGQEVFRVQRELLGHTRTYVELRRAAVSSWEQLLARAHLLGDPAAARDHAREVQALLGP